jgi:hypothetical protein
VPVINGAKIEMVTKSEGEDNKLGFWIMCTSDKSFKDVKSYYEKELGDIEEVQQVESENFYSISGRKNNTAVAVTVTGHETDGKKTSGIQIIIGKNK